MDYIAHTRFRGKALCGRVNIPAGTKCRESGGVILYGGGAVCAARSENAHQYFARDDDGCGMERGRLTRQIQKTLQKRDKHYQDRWDRIWADPICQKYKRCEHEDFWLWNHEFFNAPIFDLRHIAGITEKGGRNCTG